MTPRPPEDRRVTALRESLPATGAGIYLAAHAAGPLPAETAAALGESAELELRTGRAGPGRHEDVRQREEEARAVVAAALGVAPERTVLAPGTAAAAIVTATQALVLRRQRGQPTTRVMLVGGLESPVAAALRMVAEASGLKVDRVSAPPGHVTAGTAFVAASHLDEDGLMLDVPAMVYEMRHNDAWLLLDLSRSCGALPFDLPRSGVQVALTSTDRWLLGPPGTAAAWFGPDLGDELPGGVRSALDPLDRAALLGLGRSVGWLLMYVGLPFVHERTRRLRDALVEGLTAIEGVDVVAPRAIRGALVAFRIPGWQPAEAAEELSHRVFAIMDIEGSRPALRVSVGAWNREDEIERFCAAVAELVGHTPETVPRRPKLTILPASSVET